MPRYVKEKAADGVETRKFVGFIGSLAGIPRRVHFQSLISPFGGRIAGSGVDVTDLKQAKLNSDKMAQAKSNFLANMR